MLELLAFPKGREARFRGKSHRNWGFRGRARFGTVGLFSLVFIPAKAGSPGAAIVIGFDATGRIQLWGIQSAWGGAGFVVDRACC